MPFGQEMDQAYPTAPRVHVGLSLITVLPQLFITNLRPTNHKLSGRLKMINGLVIEVLFGHDDSNDVLHEVSTQVFHRHFFWVLNWYDYCVNSQRHTSSLLHPVFARNLQRITLQHYCASLNAIIIIITTINGHFKKRNNRSVTKAHKLTLMCLSDTSVIVLINYCLLEAITCNVLYKSMFTLLYYQPIPGNLENRWSDNAVLTTNTNSPTFCSSGPTSWNTLPARLQHSSLTLEQCLLKVSLFAWLSPYVP